MQYISNNSANTRRSFDLKGETQHSSTSCVAATAKISLKLLPGWSTQVKCHRNSTRQQMHLKKNSDTPGKALNFRAAAGIVAATPKLLSSKLLPLLFTCYFNLKSCHGNSCQAYSSLSFKNLKFLKQRLLLHVV